MPDSQPDAISLATVAAPPTDDREGWRAYWAERGWRWRREAEIDAGRQAYLATRRMILADVERGIYPFNDVTPRLARADLEWLLVTRPPGAQLDLRGADLRGLDLRGLPLAGLRGGLAEDEWRNATARQIEAAALHAESADFGGADLTDAILEGAHLEGVRLRDADLSRASLSFAFLEAAVLADARLERATLLGALLDGATISGARLEHANLSSASLAGADLFGAHLEGAQLRAAHLAGKALAPDALARVRRARPDLPETLPGASIGGVFFDSATLLDDARLGDETYGGVAVADARWGGVNLAVVDWAPLKTLGDELEARAAAHAGTPKDEATRFAELRTAVRANRQLAVALREQGLNEEADRFAYRAQLAQREVLRRQALGRNVPGQVSAGRRAQRLGAYVFSSFLDLLAGYGYKPGRSLAAYLGSLIVFAAAYFALGQSGAQPLSVVDAMALSINSFHGRGFLPGTVAVSDAVTVLTALEAMLGLIIEISFIATFTQRFFAR